MNKHYQTETHPLIFLGAGTENLAREARQIADDAGRTVLGYVDEDPSRQGGTLDDIPVYGMREAAREHPHGRVICTLATTQRKSFIERSKQAGFEPGRLIHPSTRIPEYTEIGEGTWIHPGTVVAAETRVGRHVMINRGSLIGHDVVIGSFTTITPGVNIGGVTSIGDHVYVGMGATIRNGVDIGDGALIGAGAVVVDDVPSRTKVLGVPAKPVDNDIERY